MDLHPATGGPDATLFMVWLAATGVLAAMLFALRSQDKRVKGGLERSFDQQRAGLNQLLSELLSDVDEDQYDIVNGLDDARRLRDAASSACAPASRYIAFDCRIDCGLAAVVVHLVAAIGILVPWGLGVTGGDQMALVAWLVFAVVTVLVLSFLIPVLWVFITLRGQDERGSPF